MKKFLLGLLAIVLTLQVQAQNLPTWAIPGDYVNGSFPLFWTNIDTLKGNGAYGSDTFKAHLERGYYSSFNNNLQSVTFTNNIYLASVVVPTVTPTVTGAIYGSANNGFTYDWTAPIATFTLTATTSFTVAATDCITTVSRVTVINPFFGGNPYTDYLTVLTGHVSDTVQWTSSVLTR